MVYFVIFYGQIQIEQKIMILTLHLIKNENVHTFLVKHQLKIY